jgi:hypothetical protein
MILVGISEHKRHWEMTNTAFHIYGQIFFFSRNNCFVSVAKQYEEIESGGSDSS